MRQFLTILTLITILASAKPLSEQSAEEPMEGLPIWLLAVIAQPKPIEVLVDGEKAEVTPMFTLSEAIDYVNEIHSMGVNYVIQLSASTYRETKPAVVPTNTTIKGKGRGRTILSFECDCAVAMEISSEGNVRVEDLALRSLSGPSRNTGIRAAELRADVVLSNLQVETSATDYSQALAIGSTYTDGNVSVLNSIAFASAGKGAYAIAAVGNTLITNTTADVFSLSGDCASEAEYIPIVSESYGEDQKNIIIGSELGTFGGCADRAVYAMQGLTELKQTNTCGAIWLHSGNAVIDDLEQVSCGYVPWDSNWSRNSMEVWGGSISIRNSRLSLELRVYGDVTNFTFIDSVISVNEKGYGYLIWDAPEESKFNIHCENVVDGNGNDFCSALELEAGL